MELSSGSLSYTVMIDLPDSRPGNGAKFILGVESAGVGQADASSPILVPRPFAPRLPPEQCLKSISWNKVSQGQYWRRSHTINWEDVPSHSAEESWIAKGRLSLLQQHFAGKRSLNDSKRLSRLRKFRGWALCEKVLLSWCLIGTRREIVRALRAKREARLKQRTFLLLFPYADEVQQADFCEVSREELLRTFLDVTESLPPPPMSPLGRRCVEMERVNSELLRDDSCESARGAGGSPQFRYGESAEWPSREEELWALETRFAAWFRPRFAARCMMRFAEATVRSKTKALLMENWRTRLRSTCLLCWADNVALRMHNRELCYLGRLMVQRQALMPWKLAIRHNLAAASQYRAETLQRRVLYALLLSAATSEHAHARREVSPAQSTNCIGFKVTSPHL
jgi:hypothetical protein